MATKEVLKALPIPAMTVGNDLRVLHQNKAAEKLLGVNLIGRHVATAIRQPALLEAIEETLKGSQPRNVRHILSDGTREIGFDVHVASIPSDAAVMLSFLDVSSHEEAGQMRSDFVANVSHELRTPLTALSGFIETLRGPARDDADARDRFLDIMVAEANRMNRLVTDLLSLSRVEDMVSMRPTDLVELDQIILMVINALGPTAKEKSVQFETVFDATCPVMVMGDRDQLTQVFTNLFENAIKYGNDSSIVHVAVERIVLVPAFKGPGIRITVRDEGEGIAHHHIGRLTERFYRVDSHRSRALGGTGLGLAIVKHIVNRHRGRFRIESTMGQGSTFTVTLPTPTDI